VRVKNHRGSSTNAIRLGFPSKLCIPPVQPFYRADDRAAKARVIDAITTAQQKLIASCGGNEAARHLIDNVMM
jgi:hypothetical protein